MRKRNADEDGVGCAGYAGKKFSVRYRTNGYYDIRASESGFQVRYRQLTKEVLALEKQREEHRAEIGR